jgi:hypothetical protein
MSLRPLDIMFEEPTIKGDRFGEPFDPTVRPRGETATPGLFSHLVLSRL